MTTSSKPNSSRPDFLLYVPKYSYTTYLCPPCRRQVFQQKTVEQVGEDEWEYKIRMCGLCRNINKEVGKFLYRCFLKSLFLIATLIRSTNGMGVGKPMWANAETAAPPQPSKKVAATNEKQVNFKSLTIIIILNRLSKSRLKFPRI
jgi:hypothetical protein